MLSTIPTIAQTSSQKAKSPTQPNQTKFPPMSEAERAARYNANLEKWQKEYGLDPGIAQRMSTIYRNQSQGVPKAPPSVAEFAKQIKYGKTTTTNNPPSDFPIPVFKGSNTQYTIRQNVSFSDPRASITMTSLSLTTSDTGKSVSSWYKAALSQSGWKVNDPYAAASALAQNPQAAARIPGGLGAIPRNMTTATGALSRSGISYMEPISAQKGGAQCYIQITEYSNPQHTEVTLSAGKPQG